MKINTIDALRILRNSHSKAWNKRNNNIWLIAELKGCGKGTAYKICDEMDIYPESYHVPRK